MCIEFYYLQMWCDAFNSEEVHTRIRTNNGIERQNESLKYEYLNGYKNCSLSEFLTILMTHFLPDSYLR